MKKHLLVLSLSAFSIIASAQQSAREAAYSFMRNGDFSNAILVLNKAIQSDPKNQQLKQDLALSYYYKKDYVKAKEVVQDLLDRDDTEVVSYQIAGNVFKALEELKDAEKMYKKALKKYPDSGPIYNEYGELLSLKGEFAAAIKIWEKGIEAAPSYPGNYFNAASFYYTNNDPVWAMIYGEIFANMEYLTDRGFEIRKMLLNLYRDKIFDAPEMKRDKNEKNDFGKSVQEVLLKQKPLTGKGLTIEGLSMIRTKFIFDWFNQYAAKYPYRLFDYQQQLIREGLFEAYNQWLFGSVDNLQAYDQWSKQNHTVYSRFDTFQKGRVFKMPPGHYYKK